MGDRKREKGSAALGVQRKASVRQAWAEDAKMDSPVTSKGGTRAPNACDCEEEMQEVEEWRKKSGKWQRQTRHCGPVLFL